MNDIPETQQTAGKLRSASADDRNMTHFLEKFDCNLSALDFSKEQRANITMALMRTVITPEQSPSEQQAVKDSVTNLPSRQAFVGWHAQKFPDAEIPYLINSFGLSSLTENGSMKMNARWEGWLAAMDLVEPSDAMLGSAVRLSDTPWVLAKSAT